MCVKTAGVSGRSLFYSNPHSPKPPYENTGSICKKERFLYLWVYTSIFCSMAIARTTSTVLLIIAGVFILVITKDYLIPLVLAMLIWYIIREVREFLQKSRFIRNRLPMWVQNTLSFLLIVLIVGIVADMLGDSARKFSNVWPSYEANLQQLNNSAREMLGIDLMETLSTRAGDLELEQFISPVINSLSSVLGDFFLVIIYCVFLLLEESVFRKKFHLVFKSEDRYEKVAEILRQIDYSFGKYISLKTLVSVMTGVLSYIVLALVGIDSPVLWSFIIFLLNFIPSIGSLIGTLFPTLITLLQFGEVMPAVWILLGVGTIQVIIGNVVEPRIMGNSLNISPLVVIVSLIAWGAIWGVVGMVLSVPIMVMLIIIFAQFPDTYGAAVLLSDSGDLSEMERAMREHA